VHLGGYVLVRAQDPHVVLVGTGSEVAVCVAAAELLAEGGWSVQVSSLPSWDRFALQHEDYQEDVLPSGVPTLAVEAGVSFGWDRWADDSVSIDRFGASAPGDQVLANMGFTADYVVERALALFEDLEEIV
jgi:transketolase